jgi:hypothetical protein
MALRSSIAGVILAVVVGLACAGCYNPAAAVTICGIDPDTSLGAVLGHGEAPVFQNPRTIQLIQ